MVHGKSWVVVVLVKDSIDDSEVLGFGFVMNRVDLDHEVLCHPDRVPYYRRDRVVQVQYHQGDEGKTYHLREMGDRSSYVSGPCLARVKSELIAMIISLDGSVMLRCRQVL